MKITKLHVRGIGRFYEDCTLPVDELGSAALVAVCGNNGEGKSSMLECIPAALYRHMPSRNFAGMPNRNNSLVELGLDMDGQRFTAVLKLNGTGRTLKTEAYLYDGDGKVLSNGKVRDYAAKVAEIFPPRDVFFSSAFAAQTGEGRFLDLAPTDRKALFAKLLGLSRLEELSTESGEQARAADKQVAELRAKASGLQGRVSRLGALREDLATCDHSLTEQCELAEHLAADIEDAHRAAEAWSAKSAELANAVAEAQQTEQSALHTVDSIKAELRALESRISDGAVQTAGLKQKLGKRAELEQLIKDADGLDDIVRDLDMALASMREQEERYRKAFEDWSEHRRAAERDVHDAETRCAREVAAAEVTHLEAKRLLEAAQAVAEGLSDVPCGGDGPYAACPLIATATKARGEMDAAVERAAETEAEWEASKALREPVRIAKTRLDEVMAEKPEPPNNADREAIEQRRDTLRRLQASAAEAEVKLEAIRDAEQMIADIGARLADMHAVKAELRDRLTRASSVLAVAEDATRRAQLLATQHSEAVPKSPSGLRTEAAAVQRRIVDLSSKRAALETQIADAEATAEQLREIDDAVTSALAEQGDWEHLQKALGRNGVQALEVDAAGPDVSDLTNELLHSCYGSRFTVSLETTRLKSDGKSTKEVFDLNVIDTERGTEGSAGDLSGGEKVLVSEALSLAIAIYNARRSSMPLHDLFRDECAGALSTPNAYRYIEMLRRAIDLGGFHRCYFVAHQPQLWDEADARILVHDGKCEVVGEGQIKIGSREATAEDEAA